MKKVHILKAFIAIIAAVAYPAAAHAWTFPEAVEETTEGVSLSISGNTLHVGGAAGLTLAVYNVAGVQVMACKVDRNDKRIDMDLPKGCYIVKVGRTVRKVSVR